MNILKTLNVIAQCSQPSSGVTRLPFTKEHKQANKIITQWMKDAGMQVHLDAAGTLIGTYKSSNKNAKTLILGSHQDSVINAGRFDGIMGVLLPILAVKKLHQKKIKLPFHIECVAFADEEGVRFPTAPRARCPPPRLAPARRRQPRRCTTGEHRQPSRVERDTAQPPRIARPTGRRRARATPRQ